MPNINRKKIERDYESLINDLVAAGNLQSPQIIKAFRVIKRFDFVLPVAEAEANLNMPLSIGQEQTISQPATVAIMLELLQPEKGQKILDVGSGSGWTTTLLAELVGREGRVFGLELLPAIHRFGSQNIDKYDFVKKGIAKNICADGYKGLAQEAPFDRILVSAAAQKIPPTLLNQLSIGGRLVMPVGPERMNQELVLVEKITADEYREISLPGFVFVPLVAS